MHQKDVDIYELSLLIFKIIIQRKYATPSFLDKLMYTSGHLYLELFTIWWNHERT